METIPITTTHADPPSDRDKKLEELDRLLAEDSRRGEHLHRLRDMIRTRVFGLEPLCEDEEDRSEDDPEPQMDN
ncbi:MAG: hypothetical protein OXP70_09550 [Acidobacteriota bacterium]|nr:hypothetical protein [Acidobacteriota bacterium]